MMKTRLKFLVMLLAMMVGGVMMLVPQGVKAQGLDGLTANRTFDFVSLAQQSTTIVWGDEYTGSGLYQPHNPKYMDNINGVGLEGRFAAATNSSRGWFLRNDANYTVGLWCYGANYSPQLAICGMWNGDRVRIKVVGTIKFTVSNSAKVYVNGGWEYVRAGEGGHEFSNCEFVFAAIQSGDVIIEGTGANSTIIQKVEFFYSGNGVEDGVDRGVSFTSPPSTLNVGQTYDGNNANVYPSWATPMFTSSNNAVATVDKYGVVTAVYPGTATITATLDIGPVGNAFAAHDTARFTLTVPYSDEYARYNYDPAVEVYDLSSTTGNYFTSQADFQLNGGPANYLTSLSSGLSLNNRIAVDSIQYIELNNGLKNNTNFKWFMLSIANLKADDRVRITYEDGNGNYGGNQVLFGSDLNTNLLESKAFKDFNNNGTLDVDEHMITRNEAVDKTVFYTMTEDGHLDIIAFPQVKITKIEIYGDHQAAMVDKYNGSAAAGYTAYFSSTGQLMAKEHMVPGGLEVHIGNENDTQHAIVVSSDKGPVSFVYDQDGYKMARRSDNSTYLDGAPPSTGTFYKFMPDVNGTMTVRFKAYSVKYDNYEIGGGHGKDAGNEHQVSGSCPYYLMLQDGGSYSQVTSTSKNNGADVTFTSAVTGGKVYYLYGGWANPSNYQTSVCGVAQLIDVTFVPNNMVAPLAKCVASGTTSDVNLASVSTGTTTNDLHIKKMSGNITACNPYIENGTLKINGITFAQNANPGGTILIKIGDPTDDNAPVFAYTIAYDAGWNNGEGHTWNFSDGPLRGLKWNNTSSQADVTNFGTANDDETPSLLHQQMHQNNNRSDWTFVYRIKTGNDSGLDPMYLNKNPMQGDNANIIWDTEGLIINTGSNQSAINNEYKNVSKHDSIDHSNTTDRPDPDRYVGILPGGEFRIPNLNAGDRVIIYMGSGKGSGREAIYMNITNAKDAVGTPINDISGPNVSPVVGSYRVGGSLWQADSEEATQRHGTPYYKGAYHFIAAADGDMIFKLEDKGTLAKLYSIKIYTGKHEHTNDATRATQTYNGINYNRNAYQYFNRYDAVEAQKGCYSMHWRGKGESLRTPTVLYSTGNVSYDENHLFHGMIGNNHYIFYKSEKNQFGMFRMRIDVMNLGGNYVADYGLQNITVGCLDKMTYPYTWDFTDLIKYAYTDDTNKRIKKALSSASDYLNPNSEHYEPNEYMANAVVEWEQYNDAIDDYDGYGLHIQNSDFSGEMVFPSESQLYAGDEIIAETQGLDFIQMSTQQKRNGRLRIANQGLYLYEQNNSEGIAPDCWRIMIPDVPAGAAVYVRAKQLSNRGIIANVGDRNTTFSYTTKSGDDYIYATSSGSGGDMTLYLSNVVLQKIAISTDKKQFNSLGWTSESRDRDIDAELTSYMSGKDIKTYMVSDVKYDSKTVTLADISYLRMPKAAANGSSNACILRNTAGTALSLVDGGFHLFVPDMHDETKWTPDVDSKMKAQLTAGTVPMWGNDAHTILNYAFTYEYVKVNPDTGVEWDSNSGVKTGKQAFYRIVSQGATSTGNQGYLPVSTTTTGGASRFTIMLDGEDIGLATLIEPLEAVTTDEAQGTERYYNLNGQQLSGKPNRSGLYIKNGKKIYVKNK